MRPLTDDEMKTMFEKLSKYMGDNVQQLIHRADGKYCFRLHKDRVYYVLEDLVKRAGNFSRDHLVSMGVKIGKFNQNKKFRIHITALDQIAEHAKYKVWIKPSNEMSFLYGNHVTKNGLAKITENTPQYAGVVVFNLNNVPLGFGLAAQTTDNCRNLAANGTVVLHQADIGEYLRDETVLI